MRTVRTKVYKFSELSESAKQKAIEHFYDINVSYEWWDFTYEDAANIGLKITGFDLDKQRIGGELTKEGSDVIAAILKEHGKKCETHKTALRYKKTFNEYDNMSEECGISDDIENSEHELLLDLLEDYRIMLQAEFDYQTSKEAIIDTIEANEYEFTKDGKQF